MLMGQLVTAIDKWFLAASGGGVYYVMIEWQNIPAGKMGIGCLGLGFTWSRGGSAGR